jgi:class 3 adenylate cyclase/tetratricopeptide (TPR) repeat protein
MKCPRCQRENPPQAKFCLECGAPVSLSCASCGAELPPSAKFCLECGARVRALDTPKASRFVTPEVYTPKHLAERIITSKAALEGERKQVTVVFADLKGSMELLADRDPEEARKFLDPVLERMMEAVHRYEGTVNQVMGDGIMALFGAPIAHEDHAVRACYAVLRMQESVGRYADELRRAQGVDVQVRIGLNSGEVVVRSIGSDLRMDYTAVGQTTHLAARMEQLARPGTALLTAGSVALAEDFIQVRSLGLTPVKGLNEPIAVYELLGATAARSRFQAHAARGLTKFVGRTGEMTQLVEALELARGGRGQVVGAVGEPGVGKSRLFWEFTHSHRVEGCRVVGGASVSYGKSTTYLPVIELLRDYFQLDARDDTRKIREKVTGKLFSQDRVLEPTLPALLALLDMPVDDETWTRLDPPQRRQRTLDALKRLLLRESQMQPLVVVFEDLHWVDAESQAILEAVIDGMPTARMLLLVNYRPEYRHGWGSKTYYRQIRLDALPAASADELLELLLGADARLTALKRVLIERTERNPFFLEESVRTLVELGVLAGTRGDYQLLRSVDTLQIPPTAQAVLASRIDRLAAEDKRLLQAAAVIGKDVPLAVLEAIGEVGVDTLAQGLDRLRSAEFLYETRLFPDVEYTFRHALTHEVAYGSLLAERRRVLHARIVEAVERLYPDRLSEHAERLAHHALRGGVPDKAVAYCRQAGAKALALSANREAATYYEQALSALGATADDRETRTLGVDLRVEMRHALWPLGENLRIIDSLGIAETLVEALGDERRLVQVLTTKGYSVWMLGDFDRVIASSTRARTVATGLGDFALEAGANFSLGLAYYGLGDYGRAAELLERNRGLLQGERAYGRFATAGLTSVLSFWLLALCKAQLGAFADAIAAGKEAVGIAEARDHKLSVMFANLGLGDAYLMQGNVALAIPALEHGLASCRTWEFPMWTPWLGSRLGTAYTLAGRTADACPLLEEAMEQSLSMRWQADAPLSAVRAGEAYLATGRTQDACAIGERALALAIEQKARGYQAWALRLSGKIASMSDGSAFVKAVRHFRDALRLANELGMRPLVAHCHRGLGKLYHRSDKRQEAQEHLATATTMYRDMGMTYWLEKAEAGDDQTVAI